MKKITQTTLFVTLLLAAASAAARDTSLNVDDQSLLATMRMEVAPPSDVPPGQPHGGFALELGFSTGGGSSNQGVGGGQNVTVGGATLPGPFQISNVATLRQLDALIRWRNTTEQPWMVEVLGGLSAVNYEFKTSLANHSGTPNAAVLGVGGLWRVRPQTTLHARYLVGKGVSSYTEDVSLDRLELSVVQSISRHFSARLGYAVWDTVVTPSEPSSELHTRLRGPMFGFDLAF